MTIIEIYNQYQIPPNLQRHMLEVGAVTQYILDNWQGPAVDRGRALKAALLHDMGNIIKFKRPFFGDLERDAQHWEQVQAKFIEKYGTVVHPATCAIVTELGLGDELVPIFEEMKRIMLAGVQSGVSSDQLEDSWEARIVEYADCCVTPEGIVGFEVRLSDLQDRYGDIDGEVEQCLRSNAQKVQENVIVDLDKVGELDFSQNMLDLKHLLII